MAYTINKTDGTKLVALRDGTVDIATTDLALFGKGYAGFGERLNENFVKVLENFANTTAPANKIKGQLWYDTLANQIKVWNGSKFKPVGSSTTSAAQPTNANTGDMWFDTNNSQLYVYSGTAWTLIGPTAVAGSGVTQVSSETIKDNAGVNKSILKFITNDTIVGIVSAEEFTPQTAIAGFATIYKGITLSTDISNNRFRGVATTATGLLLGDDTTIVLSDNFLRSDTTDTAAGLITFVSGVAVGTASKSTITQASNDLIITNTVNNGDIIFNVKKGGVADTTVMTLDGATGSVQFSSAGITDLAVSGSLTVTGNLTVTGTQVVVNTTTLSIEDNIIELNRNISSAAGMPNYSGLKVNRGETSSDTEQDLYWVWDETFADDGTTAYGNAGGAWTAFKSGGGDELSAPTLVDIRANIVHATSTTAQYADLAERYAADAPMTAGDVVILGGDQEITLSTKELDTRVFGVISEAPAFLMNKDAGNNDSHPMVALQGRVRVKVEGKGKKGDRIVSSSTAGVARVVNLDQCTAFNVLGRLLQDKYDIDTELTECVIGVK
jgi:hypothetical protein